MTTYQVLLKAFQVYINFSNYTTKLNWNLLQQINTWTESVTWSKYFINVTVFFPIVISDKKNVRD